MNREQDQKREQREEGEGRGVEASKRDEEGPANTLERETIRRDGNIDQQGE